MGNTICYFFIFLTEAVILWQYAFPLFAARYKTRTVLTALCGLYLILFAASLFESKWLNVALYFMVNFLFLAVYCFRNWSSAFFHSSMLTAVMVLCELMVYYIITYFAPHFFTKGEYFHHLVIFTIFSKLMFFTVIYVLSHFPKSRQGHDEQQRKPIFLLTLIPVTSIFVMLTFIRISDSCTFSRPLNWMITLSAVFLLAINLLIFGINQYEQKKNLEFTQMQLLLQKESDSAQYYKMLLMQNENQNILIHDIKKHLQSIDMLNSQKENRKISAYIHQLMNSSDLQEVSRLCGHEMLNAILSRYQKQCADRQIAFHADIRSDTVDFLSDADLTSLFCNLLDNATEAADGIPDSFIELNTGRREKTPFVVITVINSSRKNPFSEKNGALSTNKPNKQKHGFGLKSIRKIVNKYHGDLQMYYHPGTLTFHTIITLKQP